MNQRFAWSLLAGFAVSTFVGSQGEAAAFLSAHSLSDGRVEIRWTDPAGTLLLERSAALGAAAAWTQPTVSPQQLGDRYSVTLTPGPGTEFYRLFEGGPIAPTRIATVSPTVGETGVAVTRETIVRFSGPLAAEAVLTAGQFYAEFGGRRILARAALSSDRRTATLFYLENLPGSARIQVVLEGADLRSASGLLLDLDGNGEEGGRFETHFSTSSVTGVPGTGLVGHVYASEPNLDGSNKPLEGVLVTVDGAEETLRAVTDSTGFFQLEPAPVGRFFVHVDGRTAVGSRWPGGPYYPFVGKAWETTPGRSDNPAGGSGEVFLPLIPADALQPVSATETTVITFPEAMVADDPALAGVTVSIPPNSLFSDNGTPGGLVGIAPVPPDRLPEPLPPGLNLPIVITIQTDGPQNFDVPVPVRFPNLPDPVTGEKLPPGATTVLWSFNHDTGRWEMQGTMTITPDGAYAVTDPGVGVLQPGWHGNSPGSSGGGPRRREKHRDDPPVPPRPDRRSDRDDDDDCEPQVVYCNVNLAPPGAGTCALRCVGDYVSNMFRKRDGTRQSAREPIELGLCAGNITLCSQEDTLEAVMRDADQYLSTDQRDCMDACINPNLRIPVIADCDDLSPCAFLELLNEESQFGRHGRHGASDIIVAITPRSWLVEQRLLWKAGQDYLALVFGTRLLGETAPAEVPLLRRFLSEFEARSHPDSPAGRRLSPAERAELLALPHPSNFTSADWTALVDRLDLLAGNALPAAQWDTDGLRAAGDRWRAVIEELLIRGWRREGDGLVYGLTEASAFVAPAHGSALFPARSHYYRLIDLETGFEQVGRLTPDGLLPPLILRPEAFYAIAYVDPETFATGAAFFLSARAGQTTVVPSAPLYHESEDTDGDGLPDAAELVIGTDPTLVDTDGDGLSDATEVREGTNPLDGLGMFTGVVGSTALPGVARDLAIADGHAFVAAQTAGLQIVSLADRFIPARVGSLAVEGSTLSVAVEGSTAVLASTQLGLVLVDVSDPTQPRIRHTVPLADIGPVAIQGRWAYGGGNLGALVVVDILTGQPRFSYARLGTASRIDAIVPAGDWVYVLANNDLVVLRQENGLLFRTSSRQAAGGVSPLEFGRKLFVAEDRGYVGYFTGFSIFDLSDPFNPVLRGTQPATQAAIHHFAAATPDLLLPTTSFGGVQSLALSLYDVSDPTDVTRFLTSYITPGGARAAAVHRGLAYVASGPGGLAVVSFTTLSNDNTPPSVSLGLPWSGPQPRVEPGAVMRVPVHATDNMLVREVALLLDGEVVARDGGYPFEFSVRAPAASGGKTSFILQATATDLAGNAASSAPVNVSLVPDATAPAVVAVFPPEARTIQRDLLDRIEIEFDEPVVGVQGGTLQLFGLGPDGLPNTDDDMPVALESPEVEGRFVRADLLATLATGNYRAVLAAGPSDNAGNARTTPLQWLFTASAARASLSSVSPSGILPTFDTTIPKFTALFNQVLPPERAGEVAFTLTGAGPDGQFGTADDTAHPVTVEAYDLGTGGFRLDVSPPLGVGRYRLRAEGAPVTTQTRDFELRDPRNFWVRNESGRWQDAANWSYPLAANQEVIIDRPGVELITTNITHVPVLRSIRSEHPFRFTTGNLGVTEEAVFNAVAWLGGEGFNDTALTEGTFRFRGGLDLLSTSVSNRRVALFDATLINENVTRWINGDIESQGEHSLFVNAPGALFEFGEGGSNRRWVRTSFNQPVSRFLNAGLIHKPVGTGTNRYTLTGVQMQNEGQILVESGTLELAFYRGGGSVEARHPGTVFLGYRAALDPAARISGDGTVIVGGDFAVGSIPPADIPANWEVSGLTRVLSPGARFARPLVQPTGRLHATGGLRLDSPVRLGELLVNISSSTQQVTLNAAIDVDHLRLERGTVTGPGGIEIRESFHWQNTPVLAGDPIIFSGHSWTLTGGSLSNRLLVLAPTANARVTNSTAATVTGPTLDNPNAGIVNQGLLDKTGTGVLTISVPFTNSGVVRVSEGVLDFNVRNLGRLIQGADGILLLDGGELRINSSGRVTLAEGTLAGTGTIAFPSSTVSSMLTVGGRLEPGNPTGPITVRDRSIELTATSETVLTLTETEAGYVEGPVTLAGALRLVVAPGSNPPIGTTWTLISNRRGGSFDRIEVEGLEPGKRIVVDQASDSVTAEVVPE